MVEDREGQCYIQVRTWNLYVGKLHRIYVISATNSGRAWAWDWFWQLERGVRSEDVERAAR